jgi:hypothetical protein
MIEDTEFSNILNLGNQTLLFLGEFGSLFIQHGSLTCEVSELLFGGWPASEKP